MNKVKLNVMVEKKVDNRKNNTGRPVNHLSARQQRLRKQSFYNKQHNAFVSGKSFKINNDSTGVYAYEYDNTSINTYGGCILNAVTGLHVCNIEYVGRTKVLGYTFVMGKRVNVKINLKEVKFDYKFI